MTLYDTKQIMAATRAQRLTNASGNHSCSLRPWTGGVWYKRCPTRSRVSSNIIVMFMLLAPVAHALEVWCEELTRIFGASQPPHCGHVFRMGEGHSPPIYPRPGWTYGGVSAWLGPPPRNPCHCFIFLMCRWVQILRLDIKLMKL